MSRQRCSPYERCIGPQLHDRLEGSNQSLCRRGSTCIDQRLDGWSCKQADSRRISRVSKQQPIAHDILCDAANRISGFAVVLQRDAANEQRSIVVGVIRCQLPRGA